MYLGTSADGAAVAIGFSVLVAVYSVYMLITDWNPPNSSPTVVIGTNAAGLVLVELVGLYIYFQFYHRSAFETLIDGGLTPASGVAFLVASPDRLLVAVSLAVLAVVSTLTGSNDPTFQSGGP